MIVSMWGIYCKSTYDPPYPSKQTIRSENISYFVGIAYKLQLMVKSIHTQKMWR